MAMVGRIAGVSQVTVSRALSEPSKVSPATLKKTSPSLTSFRVGRAALGACAAQAILGRLGEGNPTEAVTDIGFEIVRRESA